MQQKVVIAVDNNRLRFFIVYLFFVVNAYTHKKRASMLLVPQLRLWIAHLTEQATQKPRRISIHYECTNIQADIHRCFVLVRFEFSRFQLPSTKRNKRCYFNMFLLLFTLQSSAPIYVRRGRVSILRAKLQQLFDMRK